MFEPAAAETTHEQVKGCAPFVVRAVDKVLILHLTRNIPGLDWSSTGLRECFRSGGAL